MKATKLGTRNYIFTYKEEDWDLNLHLIKGDQYNYVIDTGLGSDSVAVIKEYLDDSKPTIVINTHFHWDHIWGNHCFENSVIIASKEAQKRMAQSWDMMLAKNQNYVRGEVRKQLPTLVFEEELYFPEDQIYLFISPGHSADGISVYDEKDRVLNAGDNIGDTMEALLPEQEVRDEVFIGTLRKYQYLEIAYCVSGHNQVITPTVFEDMIALIGTRRENQV